MQRLLVNLRDMDGDLVCQVLTDILTDIFIGSCWFKFDWHSNAELTEDFVVRAVPADAALQHHPETVHAGMGMQIVVAVALFDDLNCAPDDVRLT